MSGRRARRATIGNRGIVADPRALHEGISTACAGLFDLGDIVFLILGLIRRHFKLISLALVVGYYGIITTKQTATGAWSSTRSLGYSQPTSCNTPDFHYGVVEVLLTEIVGNGDNSTIDSTAPLCFQSINPGSNIPSSRRNVHSRDVDPTMELCFTNEGLDKFFNTFYGSPYYIDSEDGLAAAFKPDTNRNYFYYSYVTLGVASICLTLTFLIETVRLCDTVEVQEGRFTTNKEIATIISVNSIMSVLVVGLMFASAQGFLLIQTEDCESMYEPSSPSDQFCNELAASGVVVNSVILPKDFLVTSYRSICLSLGVILLCAIAMRSGPMVRAQSNQHVIIVPIAGAGEEEMFYVQQHPGNGQRPTGTLLRFSVSLQQWVQQRVPEVQDSANRDFAQQITRIFERNRKVAKWKQYRPSQLSGEDMAAECAICLEKLFGKVNDVAVTTAGGRGARRHGPRAIQWSANAGANSIGHNSSSDRDCDLHDVETGAGASQEDDDVMQMPCGHRFHRHCIIEWMLTSNSCPICRANL